MNNSSENSITVFNSHPYLANLKSQNVIFELENRRYDVYDVPGDGSCFFHCLSLSIHGNFERSRDIRYLICSHILENWAIWQNKVLGCHNPSMTVDLYRLHMIHGNGWATAAEVEATASLLKCQIIVFFEGLRGFITQTFQSDASNQVQIDLLLSNNHYRVLRHLTIINDHTYFKKSHKRKRRLQEHLGNKQNKNEQSQFEPNCTFDTLNNENIPKPKQPKKSGTDKQDIQNICRKYGVKYENAPENESEKEGKNRHRRNLARISKQKKKFEQLQIEIPEPPPLSENEHYNKAMEAIRSFELEQLSYKINTCNVCNESRLEMKMSPKENVCRRCYLDKNPITFFSSENNMNPGTLPVELQNLSIVEQQLIAKISPCINVHMLKHGGIASSGHCVTFPQEVNEPSQILPRLPSDIHLLKVRKKGRNDTSKDFTVRRYKVQDALLCLKQINPVFENIIISQERLNMLPLEGELPDIETLEFNDTAKHINDKGPAPEQLDIDISELDGDTNSSVLLPDKNFNIKDKVESVVNEIVGENHDGVSVNKRGTVTIPWPTRGDVPVSEFVTSHFFTMAFPCLFPFGSGDFHVNRPRTCDSLADWAEHLLWFNDGRFANHQYFKFVVHNMIVRRRALENSNFIVNQKLGDSHLSISDIKEKLQNGDNSIVKKIIYLSSNLRGTPQYWSQKAKELRSLVQYNIYQGSGLPSYFCTGSCAEYYFKPLRRLLSDYIRITKKVEVDFNDKSALFAAVQENGHLVGKYFDLRTQSYFREVMAPVFNVSCYWYRQEFAKSRGMIHWHGLCWRSDREPHNLMHKALTEGLSDEECAKNLAEWATSQLGLTASHPAGKDIQGNPRKDLWPPPEGTAPPPPEEKNPLLKLLMDVSSSQESLLEDHLLLSNRINIHRCSEYCLRDQTHSKEKSCRMEFGTKSSPGKELREEPAIVRDKNRSMRLEMPRDHPMLVQHSKFHTQGWRANGDISVILSKSNPENPSVGEILAVEKYITGYACKGNQPTGAMVDLFNDMVNCADESSGATAKSLCSKLLMNAVKRDVSSTEAAYELSGLALYRSSHLFQSLSLTGARVLDKTKSNSTITKNNIFDKYLSRPDTDTNSLYGYICKQGKVPVVNGYIPASWPLGEDYCRVTLLLHWRNWRKIEDIKQDNVSWKTVMEAFLQTEECPNFIKAEVERVKHHQNIVNEDEVEDNCEYNEEEPEWMEAIRPNADYSNCETDFKFDNGGPDFDWTVASHAYPDNSSTFIEHICEQYQQSMHVLDIPAVNINTLNTEQMLAFNIVIKTIQNYRQNDPSFEPLRMIVTGTAGSGKSYLIKCLVKAVRTIYKTNNSVQVLCPTGNSANLISGVTYHSFLKIPSNTKSKEMTPPDGSVGETLQENCKDLHVLLVDERSLIGATNLGWMEFMCRCGKVGTTEFSQFWGGIPVVVFSGDDVQLPPVLDYPVYNCKSQVPAAIHGVLVWKEFTQVVALQTVIRQGCEEESFKSVLSSIRQYNLSTEQAKWLQNFQWSNLVLSKGTELLKRMDDNGLFVFPTHNDEWNHNKNKLLEANKAHPVAKITATGNGVHSKSASSDKSGGLLPILYICKGAKVMLSVNLCVPFGLFNGSMGIVVDIIYKNGNCPENSLPEVVMVEFPSYTGPSFIEDSPKIVPIIPVERRLECGCHGCKRKTIPLRLGWATTIHKCQGMTIGEGEPNRYIVIHPGTRAFESRNPGALFVALSRAKSTGNDTKDPDFAWHPTVLVNEDRLCFKVVTPTTKARSLEINRLHQLKQQTFKTFRYLNNDPELLLFKIKENLIDPIVQETECTTEE